MDKFSVQSEVKESVAIVTVNGRIDSETAVGFDNDLTKLVGGNSRLVLNLQGVDYMSSAGIRAIVKASQAVEKRGGALKLASVPEMVHSALYTVGLDQKISAYTTVDEAVASF
jgi:anti-sigma B factor antagonist